MQRLPPTRIQRADELGEIDLEEDPATAGLCAGDQAPFGAGADFFGVHVEEVGSFVQSQRAADYFGVGPERVNCGRKTAGFAKFFDVHEQPPVVPVAQGRVVTGDKRTPPSVALYGQFRLKTRQYLMN